MLDLARDHSGIQAIAVAAELSQQDIHAFNPPGETAARERRTAHLLFPRLFR